MLREGSFTLAFFGRVRKVQEPTFVVAAGRKSVAVKRIVASVFCMSLVFIGSYFVAWCPVA
jgi:hypothetical protein